MPHIISFFLLHIWRARLFNIWRTSQLFDIWCTWQLFDIWCTRQLLDIWCAWQVFDIWRAWHLFHIWCTRRLLMWRAPYAPTLLCTFVHFPHLFTETVQLLTIE